MSPNPSLWRQTLPGRTPTLLPGTAYLSPQLNDNHTPMPIAMSRQTLFASRVFLWAGIYGILVLAPLYFMEEKLFRDVPPPLTHPELFYGFLGVALAWQIAFLLIGKDVQRYRLFMIPAIAEKLLPSVAALLLYAADRVTFLTIAPAIVDLLLGLLFIVAFRNCHDLNESA